MSVLSRLPGASLLRWGVRRRAFGARAALRGHELRPVQDRTRAIVPGDLLLCCTIRDEAARLPFFLDYYRRLGIGHFLVIDNASSDDTAALLAAAPDVSVWRCEASYRRARFGMDWVNHLLARHAHDHWVLTVDADEFLVYPHADTRPLRALTDWLDAAQLRSFGTLLLDLYPHGAVAEARHAAGDDPFATLRWFDPANYTVRRTQFGNLWIQGGVRARAFFADRPRQAPALNKIPLVRWQRGYVYVSSTHMLLPRGLNRVYATDGGERPSGCLLHAKFLDLFPDRARREVARKEHYDSGREYRAYAEGLARGDTLWCPASVEYAGWRQLVALGLMSEGGWI
jgi:hypothetical protein